jgi:hypothetical protein
MLISVSPAQRPQPRPSPKKTFQFRNKHCRPVTITIDKRPSFGNQKHEDDDSKNPPTAFLPSNDLLPKRRRREKKPLLCKRHETHAPSPSSTSSLVSTTNLLAVHVSYLIACLKHTYPEYTIFHTHRPSLSLSLSLPRSAAQYT